MTIGVWSPDRLARVLRERLRPAIRRTVGTLRVEAWHLPGEPVPPAEALRYTGYKPFEVGEAWDRRGARPGST